MYMMLMIIIQLLVFKIISAITTLTKIKHPIAFLNPESMDKNLCKHMSKITFNGFGSKSPLFDEYALEDFKELVSLPLTPGDNDKYLYEQTAG